MRKKPSCISQMQGRGELVARYDFARKPHVSGTRWSRRYFQATDVAICPCSPPRLGCSAGGMLKRIEQPSNVMVFKDPIFVFRCFGYGYVHHCLAQLVGPNHQVWKRHAKRGVDGTEQTVAEIRFLTRFYWINVRWSKDVNLRESRSQESILRLALIPGKRGPAPVGGVRASATQE